MLKKIIHPVTKKEVLINAASTTKMVLWSIGDVTNLATNIALRNSLHDETFYNVKRFVDSAFAGIDEAVSYGIDRGARKIL